MSKPANALRACDGWRVAPVSPKLAGDIIRKHHYSRTAPAVPTYVHGLLRGQPGTTSLLCWGVVWWLPPAQAVGPSVCESLGLPHSCKQRVLSLSRMAIVPGAPTNAASFLLGRSIKLVARDVAKTPWPSWIALVTYADLWQNHTGAIYKATNWKDDGLTQDYPVYVDASTGALVGRKRGWRNHTPEELEAQGVRCVGRYPKRRFVKLLPGVK